MRYQNIHLIINPGAGQSKPILYPLNRVFFEAGVNWTISLTSNQNSGDMLARSAMENGADLIMAYGGDGTVNSVIRGMIGCETPLAILHGGTGNALAHELGIPEDLEKAAALILGSHSYQPLDVGEVICDNDPSKTGYFVLRTTVGLQNKLMKQATPELKEQFGNIAYIVAGLRTLAEGDKSTFWLTIDGEKHEATGLTCMISNSAAVGSLTFSSEVDPSDGLLDALILDLDFESVLQLVRGGENPHLLHGKEIKLESDPPAEINIDGEPFGTTPATIKVVPHAIKVVKGG